MMARSSKAPSMGRIQKRKTNFLQIIIFALQRAAGPYKWATNGLCTAAKKSYSITSSARASKVGAISRPIALAVFRLTTRSNLVGCSTGKSAGPAPRNTFAVCRAHCRRKSENRGP